MASGITGTNVLSGSPTGYAGTNTQLTQAIQTIWSKEILFQAMPILRFEQFAVKKTELGVMPGLTVNFMRYNNLGDASQLVEGVRMETRALSASQFQITVAEHGYAVAVTELLLNASFDDVMASASRLLGRNMALYLDASARNTLLTGTSVIFGYTPPTGARTPISPYDSGTVAANRAALTGTYWLNMAAIKDAVETLATKNVPRLGETYVAFIHPHQSRRLRDNPEFIEVSKYAAPGNFMLGEIGRLFDVVFIETTQVNRIAANANGAGDPPADVYQAIVLGDNAFGHAISLPVELRDGGILDFGREHALAWYAIWGFGLVTDQAVLRIETN
ncbi:MAG TPA: N4-gp56 family major capsid protein [Gemmatimonadales bacterium]|nr:N4-gp56 family major capsid protein [Gemmatimonadales bacterium]